MIVLLIIILHIGTAFSFPYPVRHLLTDMYLRSIIVALRYVTDLLRYRKAESHNGLLHHPTDIDHSTLKATNSFEAKKIWGRNVEILT